MGGLIIEAAAVLNEDNPEFFSELMKKGVDAIEPEMKRQQKLRSLTSEQLEENKRLKEIWKEIIDTCNNKDPEYSYNLFWGTVNDARQEKAE